jgi:hypothetical protein
MRPSFVSFIACLNIGWGLPLFYADGIAWHFSWIASGIIISLICYFAIALMMRRIEAEISIQNQYGNPGLSIGYFVAPILSYLLVLLMVKLVAKHHGAA